MCTGDVYIYKAIYILKSHGEKCKYAFVQVTYVHMYVTTAMCAVTVSSAKVYLLCT